MSTFARAQTGMRTRRSVGAVRATSAIAAVLALGAACGLVWWLWQAGGAGGAGSAQPLTGMEARAHAGAGRAQDPPAPAQPTQAAAGSRDPFLTAELRHQFEEMLLEAGEAGDPAALKQKLAALVARRFPAALAPRAMALMERYVDYRVALGRIAAPADASDPRALRAALDARQRVRERHFSPEEYEALFAQEAELDRFTLARLEIEHNPGLTPAQKLAALREAEHELGQGQRALRSSAVAHIAVASQTAAFDAGGVNEQERYAQRRAQYGDGAAQQLAQLDREEKDWQARLSRYAAAQGQNSNPAQLQQLRDQLFTAQEQMRIEGALAARQAATQPGSR